MDILRANAGRALTFDDLVKGVAERLEDDIRATLNDLTDRKQILRQGNWPRSTRPAHPMDAMYWQSSAILSPVVAGGSVTVMV